MKKFNYRKWVTENKYGSTPKIISLTEQVTPVTGSATGSGTTGGVTGSGTGSATGSATGPICHYCATGSGGTSTINSSTPAFFFQQYSYNNGYSWNMDGDCYTSGGIMGNLNLNTIQNQCGGTPTGSADWWCTGTGTTGPSCIQSSTQPSGATSGPHPDQATCQAACSQPTGSACDNSPNSQCAQQWFGNHANNFANFMSNKDCTGTHTYEGVMNNLLPQIVTLWQNRPNQNSAWLIQGQGNNYNDIHQMTIDAFGTGGSGQPQKGQFKRKVAKLYWAWCTHNACGCNNSTIIQHENKNLKEHFRTSDKDCGCKKPQPQKSKCGCGKK